MAQTDPRTITQLLASIRAGDEGAANALLSALYDELHGVARRAFARERDNHTLQPTAVIHEAWMKLEDKLGSLSSRQHFFSVASRAMRQVLADYARSQGALKRGAGMPAVSLDGSPLPETRQEIGLVELDDLLNGLAKLNARHARVVELRILGGLTMRETADELGISEGTVREDWITSRAWLRTRMRAGR